MQVELHTREDTPMHLEHFNRGGGTHEFEVLNIGDSDAGGQMQIYLREASATKLFAELSKSRLTSFDVEAFHLALDQVRERRGLAARVGA